MDRGASWPVCVCVCLAKLGDGQGIQGHRKTSVASGTRLLDLACEGRGPRAWRSPQSLAGLGQGGPPRESSVCT